MNNPQVKFMFKYCIKSFFLHLLTHRLSCLTPSNPKPLPARIFINQQDIMYVMQLHCTYMAITYHLFSFSSMTATFLWPRLDLISSLVDRDNNVSNISNVDAALQASSHPQSSLRPTTPAAGLLITSPLVEQKGQSAALINVSHNLSALKGQLN